MSLDPETHSLFTLLIIRCQNTSLFKSTSLLHYPFKGEQFEELPSDLSAMTYDHIQRIRMAYEPLEHWEAIAGMFSVADGEILRFILAYKVPLERFIRHELAGRGYDKNHNWIGFEQAAKLWLVD